MGLVVMIGCYQEWLNRLDQMLPQRSVIVLEEPDLVRSRNLGDLEASYPLVRQLWHTAYQDHEAYEPLIDLIGQRYDVEAVFASFEYAVPAAARAAQRLGLPGLSEHAAAVLRDKATLRAVTTEAGMPGPRWAKVTSAGEVAAFAGDRACVLKPANRQGSLGVLRLAPGADVDAAWDEVNTLSEPQGASERGLAPVFLVEELLDGPEYSTEALIRQGEIVFLNVTEKLVAGGRHPVELGHVAPAPDSAPWDDLRRQTARLVQVTGVQSGVVHAEWIVADGVPHLIECAGRLPGDRIVDLIDLSHHTAFVPLMVHVLAGREVPAPVPGLVAGIRFLKAAPGVVERVDGVEQACAQPGVADVRMIVEPGGTVRPVRSSWDRIGFVTAYAEDHAQLQQRLDRAEATIDIGIKAPS